MFMVGPNCSQPLLQCPHSPWIGLNVLTHLGDWSVLCRFGMKLSARQKSRNLIWPIVLFTLFMSHLVSLNNFIVQGWRKIESILLKISILNPS